MEKGMHTLFKEPSSWDTMMFKSVHTLPDSPEDGLFLHVSVRTALDRGRGCKNVAASWGRFVATHVLHYIRRACQHVGDQLENNFAGFMIPGWDDVLQVPGAQRERLSRAKPHGRYNERGCNIPSARRISRNTNYNL